MLNPTKPLRIFHGARQLSRLLLPAIAAMGLVWLIAHAAIANPDDQPVVFVAPLSMNTYDLSGGGAVAYRSDFFGGNWDGDLVAYDITAAAVSSVKWQARDQLASVDWDTGRKIFTMNGATGVSFVWSTATTASLSTTQLAALGGDSIGRQVLEFTRGSAALEGTSFRTRLSRLGDIMHSRPVYLRHSDTEERVYVGANDGMLHAFDAATGGEVFAYLPSMLLPKLAQFAVNPYTRHAYGVDGQLAWGRVTASGRSQTLLAGGLGSGARGVYSLDISNPSPATQAAAATMAKWEITDASSGFGNLGFVHGAPVYAPLNSGQTVLLVPNGINSASGRASLFLIDPQSGALLAEVPADGSGPDNGLTSISAADLNGDGRVDVVYGGDLKGTLWKFNFSGSAWPTAATALFTPSLATARPIMSAPALSLAPSGGVMVNFGTGKMLEPADTTSTDNDYLYGILDSTRVTATTLAEATLSTVTGTGTTPVQYRVASSTAPDYAAGARGWRITLAGGERLIGGDTLVNGGRFVVTTAVPNPASAGHGGWLLQIDALTGGGPARPFIDINGDGVIDLNGNADKVPVITAGSSSWQSPIGTFLGRGIWSQPVLARVNQSFDVPLFNFNNNDVLSSVLTSSTVTDPGIAGGHFDADIYYNVCAPGGTKDYFQSCSKPNVHKHQYDDTYNVVGVNLLNASEPKLNLGAAVPSRTTTFKILVANAHLSPAASLTLGTTTLAVWNLPMSPDGFVANTSGTARTFTQATIGDLILSLPTDAFSAKAWVPGNPDVRAGLVPTDTDCVHRNLGAAGTGTGPWMNGALTLQIVSSAAGGSSVELNQAGQPAAGYRLKKDTASQALQLAQYTLFWHHPDKVCVGQAGWSPTPSADTSTATYVTPASGSADPLGNFGSGGGSLFGGGTGVQTITSYLNREAVAELTYDAALDQYTRTIRARSDGSVLRTDTYPHAPSTGIVSVNRQTAPSLALGRLSWREVLR